MNKIFKVKFRIEELTILNFRYWSLSLRPNQCTLGALIVSLKRDCLNLSKLNIEESLELKKVFQEAEEILKKTFSFDKINYLCLMMMDKQVHFHVIPRYKDNREFNGVIFEDPDWPGIPLLARNDINDRLLLDIKDKIFSYVKERKKTIVGYTTGVYDLFHIGHLNVLRESKKFCDKLIVGVTSDELCFSRKGKFPIIPLNERVEIIRSLSIVDEVVPQTNMDKFHAWNKYKFDRMFVGDDWKGTPLWDELDLKFKRVGVEIFYFPYTESTSSSILREKILSIK